MLPHKKPFFTKADIKAPIQAHQNIEKSYVVLATNFSAIHFSEISEEFMTNGVFRRIFTLKMCIDKIFNILPPDYKSIPSQDLTREATIFLQCFFINTYGILDNFARILAEEKGASLSVQDKRSASFLSRQGRKKIKKITPKAISSFFADPNIQKWTGYLCDFRHALAHRIPLYIPSQMIPEDKEADYQAMEAQKTLHNFDKIEVLQMELAEFVPMTTHSFGEQSHGLIFHTQIVADWNTIIAFLCLFLREMQCPAGASIEEELELATPGWEKWTKIPPFKRFKISN